MVKIIQKNITQIHKLIKYLLMSLIIILSVKYIPDNNTIKQKEIIMIGLISSISFSLLDMISPSIEIK